MIDIPSPTNHIRLDIMLNTLTSIELDREIIDNPDGVIMVVFSSPYLGESRMMDEIIAEVADEHDSNTTYIRVDADAESDIAAEKGIYHLPTVMIYAESELVYLKVGLQGKFVLKNALDSANANKRNSNSEELF